MSCFVSGIGLCAPGLSSWSDSQSVLTGQSAYCEESAPTPSQTLLSRNDTRRTTYTIRLALQVAQEAMNTAAGLPCSELASVFACSGGDTTALEQIFTALTLPERPVSPNQFNNSVHNAPAGYWSIATQSHQPSISLSAYDGSFVAGLLEAVSLIMTAQHAVLLVAYDVPAPPSLWPFRPILGPFAVALVLVPESTENALGQLQMNVVYAQAESEIADNTLEQLRSQNPAARSLPLLQRIAQRRQDPVVLPYLPDTQLRVQFQPC